MSGSRVHGEGRTGRRRLAAALLYLTVLILSAAWFLFSRSGDITLTIGMYAGSYWQAPNANSYQILDSAIRRFEERHPHVHVEYVSGITTDAYSEWLAEQILLGKEPDLFFVLPEDFNLLVSAGALSRLDSRLDADPDFDPALFYAPCLQSGVFEGGQYALPTESVPMMMFVNKTLLEEKGIPMPDDDWKWEDFFHICQQVTDVEARRFGVYGYTWLNALCSNGASLFSEDGTACYLSDPRIQDAVRFVAELDALNGGYTVTARDFDLGNVAFRPFLFSEYRAYQPYPWRVKKYTSFQWDCVCMPAGPEGDNVSELHTMLLGLGARGRHPDLAWELAKMLVLDQEVQRELYAYSSGISPLRSVTEDPSMLAALHADIPGSGGFEREVLHKIMSTAAAAPRFERYDQALAMAESAVADELSRDQIDGSGIMTAQREINLFLNR